MQGMFNNVGITIATYIIFVLAFSKIAYNYWQDEKDV